MPKKPSVKPPLNNQNQSVMKSTKMPVLLTCQSLQKQAVKPAPALVKAKPVVDVSVNTVLSQVSKGLYIENANDVKAFIDATRERAHRRHHHR